MTRMLSALLALAIAHGAWATEYTLANGMVRFDAPATWSTIMEKNQGDPQFVVFRIQNPDAPATLSSIAVRTQQVSGAAGFRQHVDAELLRARTGPGFVEITEGSASADSLHYRSDAEGDALTVRVRFFHSAGQAVELTCSRPTSDRASATWLAEFNRACDGLARQLAQGS